MTTEYAGLPTTAKHFVYGYLSVVVAVGTTIVVAGALGAVLLNVVYPAGMVFYVVGLTSVVIHLSAIYLRDVWRGEYDPRQTEVASSEQILAYFVVFGLSQSILLLFATAVGVGALALGGPFWIAAVAAAYYPVLDVVLVRNGYWTPSGVLTWIASRFVFALLNVRELVISSLPVIWKRERKRPPA